MTALKELKKLVKDKKVDIRKVDKGQLILVIDYEQRLKIEESNILKIAEKCKVQKSNWSENRSFMENEMKKLDFSKFIMREELVAVTGLLPGGIDGKLKTATGGVRFTHATDSNELFAQQKTPYVYPLLKAHKVPLEQLKTIKPEEVEKWRKYQLVSLLVWVLANSQEFSHGWKTYSHRSPKNMEYSNTRKTPIQYYNA